ncbi:MAG: ATP-binding protein [Chloroflexota bacterium]
MEPVSARSHFWGIVAALGFVGVCTIALYPLEQSLNDPVVALLYLVAVIASTAYGGLWAGVAAAASAFLAFNYFFIAPYYTLFVYNSQDFLELFVFLGVAIFTSQAMGRIKAGLAAATIGERQALWLHELSNTLARLHDSASIADAVAAQCQRVTQAHLVSIRLEVGPGALPQVVHSPHDVGLTSGRPALIIPLESARGLVGEMAVWRTAHFSPAEERLLQTFASQGVLALERARLLHNETRTRVLEESDQLKTALLNSVSHELRTPLAAIKASVSSLRSGVVDWESAARHELLAAIEEETDHLNQLVGNLLSMSRLEAGALRPQRTWNVLGEIAGGVLVRIQRTYPQAEIETDFPPDLPLVPVDYGLMEQVFGNLVGNSLKYAAGAGPVRVKAQTGPADQVLVSVSNPGPHVPADALERIFDKFYRASPEERVTGTGLGLSICKGIVEAHGGRIWAENVPTGIVFRFTLPLQVADMPAPKSVEAE